MILPEWSNVNHGVSMGIETGTSLPPAGLGCMSRIAGHRRFARRRSEVLRRLYLKHEQPRRGEKHAEGFDVSVPEKERYHRQARRLGEFLLHQTKIEAVLVRMPLPPQISPQTSVARPL